MKRKSLVAVIAAIMMVFTMIPTMASAATKTVDVTVRAQSDGEFIVANEELTVKDGLAEEYGYSMPAVDHNNVAINDPTEFDALVAAHIAKYGDAFKTNPTDYLVLLSSGFLSKAFGEPATSSMILNNGSFMDDGIYNEAYQSNTQYLVATARLKTGDVVDFAKCVDPYCMDFAAFFTEGSKRVKPGEAFTLTLKGYMPMMGGSYDKAIPAYSDDGADVLTIGTVDKSTGTVTTLAGKTTDKAGNVTLSFDKEGTYYITAAGFVDTDYDALPIVMPWCTVTVKKEAAPTTPTTKPTPAKATVAAPAKVKATNTGWTSVKVSWNKVKGADKYKVYRATSKTGTYKKVKTVKSNKWTNTGLKAGKTYYYKVKAVKGKTTGKLSKYAKATATAKAPTLKLSAGDNKIKVTWTKVAGANGYKLYRAESKSGKYKVLKTSKGAANTAYTSYNLKAGKKYYYKVRAYKNVGGKTVLGKISPAKVKSAK